MPLDTKPDGTAPSRSQVRGIAVHPRGLQVDAEALLRVGQDVAEAAATLRNTMKTAASGLAPTPQPGSAAAAAAQRAEAAWLAELRRITGQVAGYSEALSSAAGRYRATDQANAGELRDDEPAVGR